MKKAVLLLALVLLGASFAHADIINPVSFTVTPEAVKPTILNTSRDNAEFYVTVENKGETQDTFKILLFEDPKWSYQLLPNPNDKQIMLAAGGKSRFHLLVKGSNVADGKHGVKVWIQSALTGNRNYGILSITTGAPPAPKIPPKPDFDVSLSVPSQMDPRGTYNIIATITNNNELLLDSVNIKLSSNLITEDMNVTVEPNETKAVSFAVLLMDNIPPQSDQLHVNVNYAGEEFYDADHNFEVVEYVLPFKTSVSVAKKFLREERVLTIKNEGNTKKTDTVRLESSLKERLFSRSAPKFTAIKESGKRYFAWQVSLEPEQSMEINVTTSYRILLLVAIALLLLIAYKLSKLNPLIVRKKISHVKTEHKGAVSNLSVVIYLKNRSKEPIRQLRVIERISGMVRLKQDSFDGSMHPVKMHSHEREGTLLEYRFGELSPGDERIIRYKVYSQLHIFGAVSIKPTVVEFQKKNGARRKSRSNPILLPGGEEPPLLPHERKKKF
jgi:hypothetical protein